MSHERDPEPLPDDVIAAMRSLGGEGAPAELAERVALARIGRQAAPAGLWDRVAAELGFGAGAAKPRTRVLAWPRWAAAAAVLVLAGLAWLANGDLLGTRAPARGVEAGLAPEVPDAVRRELLAGLVVREVPPEQLSPMTRSLMRGLGAPMRGEG